MLEISKLFCDYAASDSDFIELARKIQTVSESLSLEEEEQYKVNVAVRCIEVFLEDYDFQRFDEICLNVKSAGYLESYVDLLLLKGFILSSLSMSGLKRDFRISEKEKIFSGLKEVGIKENIYYDLIYGKYLFIKGDEKQASSLYEVLKKRIAEDDCASKVIILNLLTCIYEREPDKQIDIIREGMSGNCFYWNFVIQYIDYLTQRGKYLELLKEGTFFVNKLDEDLTVELLHKKAHILNHMIKASYKLNEQANMDKYTQLFRDTLNKFPDDSHGLKKNFEFLQFTHEVLYQTFFEKETSSYFDEEKILAYSKNHYLNMLRSFLIVNPQINSLLQDGEFERASLYINNIEKGLGYSKSTDELIMFMKFFAVSLLIDKSLKWKKYNVNNHKGNQTEVSLSYLEEAVKYLGELDYSFKIASKLQEIILKIRLGRLESIDSTILDEVQQTEGYDKVLAMMVSLLIFITKEDFEKYSVIKKQLLIELERYKEISFYKTWKKHLNDIFSYIDMKDNVISPRKSPSLNISQIKTYTNFLQNQLSKQLV